MVVGSLIGDSGFMGSTLIEHDCIATFNLKNFVHIQRLHHGPNMDTFREVECYEMCG